MRPRSLPISCASIPDIEPIVRMIEETPREKCVSMMIEQLREAVRKL
jgi:hypothetical protein